MKNLPFLVLSCLAIAPFFCSAAEQTEREAREYSERVGAACHLPIKFDLSDYEYGSDERSNYSNNGFQGCALLASSLAHACEKNPGNLQKMQKVKKVLCMRGSLGERKILLRKSGELVSLFDRPVSEYGKDLQTLIESDLTRTLHLESGKSRAK